MLALFALNQTRFLTIATEKEGTMCNICILQKEKGQRKIISKHPALF